MTRFNLRNGLTAMTLLLLCTAGATAQITRFTYQGQLKDGGAAFTGNADLDFTLWDSAEGGAQIGGQVSLPGSAVAAGLFTAALDFGAGAFDGAGRWLEITVNGTVLTPRQEATPAPYAMFAARPWVTTGSVISYAAGNVGIGTAAPAEALSVAGTIESTTNGFKFPDGSVQATASTSGGGFWSASGADIFNNNAGKVGIGRSDPPDPLSFANIVGDKISLFGDTGGTYGFGIQGGLLQIHTNNSTADIAFGFGPSAAFTERMRIRGNGNVGIGTTNPLSRLDIAATGNNAELLRFNTERPWLFRQVNTGPSTNLQLYSTSGAKNFEITCSSGVNCATFFTLDASPRVGIGTTAPATTLDVNGTTRTKVLQITGADLAEKFPSGSEKVEPGTVMEIDPDTAGQLRMARGEYNQRVAGVVSGANDFPAGAILGHMSGMEDAPAIALSGRVWVRCDASAAAINLGDLLTTSDTRGHAMRAVDRDRSHGAVIGKAMTCLAAGERGLVLVLVNLQ